MLEYIKKNITIGLLVIIITGVILSGCVEKSNEQTQTSGKEITITYVTDVRGDIGEYTKPSVKNAFLVITMTVQNSGYSSFNTNPNYFSLLVDGNIKYDYVPVTYLLPDALQTVDIMDGGEITGSIVFEIPLKTKKVRLLYDNYLDDYNIKYEAIAP